MSDRARRALGRRLSAARNAAGLTGPEVKARTGIDAGGLCRIEKGYSFPTMARLAVLAELYGIPLQGLLDAEHELDVEAPPAARLSPHLPVSDFVTSTDPRFQEMQDAEWLEHPELEANGRRFATAVFEPVQALLGVDLRILSGYRCPFLDLEARRGQRRFLPHVSGLAADVVPTGMCLPSAAARIRLAVARGDLPLLDCASVETSRWIHIEAAPEGQRPRRQVIGPELRCQWEPETFGRVG